MPVIRLGIPADLPAAASVYRRASLSNAGDRDNLLAHPEYLILGPEGLAEGRTYVAEEDGSVVGFATWARAGGVTELEDLFVDPGWMRRGIATALVGRIVEVLRAQGARCLEVTANPHAQGFYSATGFIDSGTAETAFGTAPRKRLPIRCLPWLAGRDLAQGGRYLRGDLIGVVERQERPAVGHRGEAGVRERRAELPPELGGEERVGRSPDDPHRAGELAEPARRVQQDTRVHMPGELGEVAADGLA